MGALCRLIKPVSRVKEIMTNRWLSILCHQITIARASNLTPKSGQVGCHPSSTLATTSKRLVTLWIKSRRQKCGQMKCHRSRLNKFECLLLIQCWLNKAILTKLNRKQLQLCNKLWKRSARTWRISRRSVSRPSMTSSQLNREVSVSRWDKINLLRTKAKLGCLYSTANSIHLVYWLPQARFQMITMLKGLLHRVNPCRHLNKSTATNTKLSTMSQVAQSNNGCTQTSPHKSTTQSSRKRSSTTTRGTFLCMKKTAILWRTTRIHSLYSCKGSKTNLHLRWFFLTFSHLIRWTSLHTWLKKTYYSSPSAKTWRNRSVIRARWFKTLPIKWQHWLP